MQKTYRIRTAKYYSFHVDIIGVPGIPPRKVMVNFTPSSSNMPGCIYTTDDKGIQFAIEKTPKFSRGEIYIEKTYGTDEETTERVEKKCETPMFEMKPCDAPSSVKEYKKIKSVQAAQNILVNDYGADPDMVDDSDKVRAFASQVGVAFPNMVD